MKEWLKNLAKEAGEITLADFDKVASSTVRQKATEKDIVTFVDKKVEQFLIEKISERFPADNFYGEETGRTGHAGAVRWIIDPIDGTAAYERGQFYYCISIAREENGKVTHGAVYAPKMKEFFYAEAGKGAFCNDVPIHVSTRSELVKCTASTGFACLRANLKKNNLKTFCVIASAVCSIRRCGSAALDLCNVAAGRYDFYWEYPLFPYDVAAGGLILKEAGGIVTDFDGGDKWPGEGVIASNAKIYDTVYNIIKQNDFR